MKNNKAVTKFLFLLAFTLCIFACEKDDLIRFDSDSQITFLPETTNRSFETSYSFLGNGTGEYVQELDVQIVGDAVDYDRSFNAKVTSDDTTTASKNQYKILEGIVKANEFQGKLYIKLFNSDALDNATISANIELEDSEDFKAGIIESNNFTVSWTNQIVLPSWRFYRFFFTTKASTSAYRIIVESTGVKRFDFADFRLVGVDGARALGTQFGDYVKQYNLDNPSNPLLHDDGDLAGEEIIPRYYTKSKFD